QRAFLTGDNFAHDNWYAMKARFLRRAPTAFTRDDVEPIAASPHDNRLDDAIGFNGTREIVQPGIVHLAARLKRIRHEAIDVDLERTETRFSCVGNQRAETLAESGAFIHRKFRSVLGRRARRDRREHRSHEANTSNP